MDKNNKLNFIITEAQAGDRLDKAVGSFAEVGTRSRAEHLIDQNCILVNGKSQKSSYRLQIGDQISVVLPEEPSSELKPLDMKLDILFEDSDLIVINKPAGLVVHPAAGHSDDTLVNALIHHTKDLSMKFGENRPGIVHRIDRDTSGILVIAKNDFAHENLAQQFKNKTTHRVYYAVGLGLLPKSKGTIQSFIGRHPTDRKRFASVRDQKKQIIRDQNADVPTGKWAVTHYQVLNKTQSGLSYVQLKLETGRTHQIRVHLSELGCPIAADATYGANKKVSGIKNKVHKDMISQFPRFALHASELGFVHPKSGQSMTFKVDWPEDLKKFIGALFS